MIDIPFQIQRFVGRVPSLYSAVQYFLYTRPYQIVTEETIMCLEGYPRSGNTFALNLVRGALVKHFPLFFSTHAERLVAHHTHRIATIKVAQRHRIPTLVLLRSPIEAITSWVVRQSAGHESEIEVLVQRGLTDYEDFYGYVSGHDNIQVVQFETVVNEPRTFVEFALCCIGLQLPMDVTIAPIYQFAMESINHWDDEQMNHTALMESFPNEEKDKEKRRVKKRMKRQYPESLRRVKCLYSNLAQIASV